MPLENQLLLKSPMSLLVTGIALGGFVWLLGGRLDSLASNRTKASIAAWLLVDMRTPNGRDVSSNFAVSLSALVEDLFGAKWLSKRCLLLSALTSLTMTIISAAILLMMEDRSFFIFRIDSAGPSEIGSLLVTAVLVNFLPGHLSLIKTWRILSIAKLCESFPKRFGLLCADVLFTVLLLMPLGLSALLLYPIRLREELWICPFMMSPCGPQLDVRVIASDRWSILIYLPLLSPSICTCLYAGSGFLLKAAGRLDVGFDWFNRHLEIEGRPLLSIGLVSGALVALVYWGVLGGLYLMRKG